MHPFGQALLGKLVPNARENVASEGSLRHSGKPQMRHGARSTVRRSISPTVLVSPSTALATKAFANQLRSWGGRPVPHQDAETNCSIRTHSRVWMTRLELGRQRPTRSSTRVTAHAGPHSSVAGSDGVG